MEKSINIIECNRNILVIGVSGVLGIAMIACHGIMQGDVLYKYS